MARQDPASRLDDKKAISALDRQGLLALAARLGEQVAHGLTLGVLPDDARPQVTRAVFCGMGGSAAAGDLLDDLLGGLQWPWSVHRQYGLPASVDGQTLVILSSYSGETEETLSAFAEASRRGCPMLCLTSGGELLRRARDGGIHHVLLPVGLPPRFALGYSLAALAVIAVGWGAARKEALADFQAACERLNRQAKRLGPDSSVGENPGKQLALQLCGHVPVIFGAAGRLQAMASRWAAQICENANQLAFSAALPEANHNLVMGWDHPPGLEDQFAAVLLQDADDHPRLALRFRATQQLLDQRGIPTMVIRGRGTTWTERFFSLLQLVDFTSLYLAVLNQVDPAEINSIDHLKGLLKRHDE